MIYMVENGIADPEQEEAWNTWYTQHVTTAFHMVPGWRTGQRFAAIAPGVPRYRAMYTVDSAEVMRGAPYKATSGGRVPDKWRSVMIDVRRNLADGSWMPAVPMANCLIVVDPPAGDGVVPEIQLTWWNVVDLDRSAERRAIAIVDRSVGEALARKNIPHVGAYVPIFEQYVV
jgi:hypothetical protein